MSGRPVLKQDWKPRHRGLIYCSPACGGNCTRAAYNDAQVKSKALARRLGPGWKPRVWENLGWHYSAVKGKAEVHVDRAVVGARGRVRGYYTMYWNVKPHIVVQATSTRALLRAAKAKINQLNNELAKLVGGP